MAIKDDDLLYVQRPSGIDAGGYKITAGDLLGGADLTEDRADTLYLSKKNDDTAAGKITFEEDTYFSRAINFHTESSRVTQFYATKPDGTLVANANNSKAYLCKKDAATSTDIGVASEPIGGANNTGFYVDLPQGQDSTGYHANNRDALAGTQNTYGFKADGDWENNFSPENYGFYSEVNANSDGGKSNYNFYSAGNAPNYFAGDIKVGTDPSNPNASINASNGAVESKYVVRCGFSPYEHQFYSAYEVDNKGNHNSYFAVADPGKTANGRVTGYYADESLGNIGAPQAYGVRSDLTTSSPNNYNFYAGGNAPNFLQGDLQVAGFYRNKTPKNPNNSITVVNAVPTHAGQDVTDTVTFVAGKAQSVTGARLTTTAYQVDSAYGSDFGDGSREAYGFKSNMAAAANGKTFNFYATNNAPNYFNGDIRVGNPTFSNTDNNVQITPNLIQVSDVNRAGQIAPIEIRRTNPTVFNNQFYYLAMFRDSGLFGVLGLDNANTPGLFNTSDYRIKSNITPLESAVDKIKQLNPCTYTAYGIDNITGFVAHELQEVHPQCVMGEKDATEAIGTLTDVDGNVETDVTEPEALPFGSTWQQTGTRDVYQSIDQTKLIPLLTKALQEALERIELLETDHATLMATMEGTSYGS